jgi:hypothetical protein
VGRLGWITNGRCHCHKRRSMTCYDEDPHSLLVPISSILSDIIYGRGGSTAYMSTRNVRYVHGYGYNSMRVAHQSKSGKQLQSPWPQFSWRPIYLVQSCRIVPLSWTRTCRLEWEASGNRNQESEDRNPQGRGRRFSLVVTVKSPLRVGAGRALVF